MKIFNYFYFRVERFVTSPLPHRPVRADFPHTVPLSVNSLKIAMYNTRLF